MDNLDNEFEKLNKELEKELNRSFLKLWVISTIASTAICYWLGVIG